MDNQSSSSLINILQSIAPGWWPIVIGGAAILISLGGVHYEINDHEGRISKLEVLAPSISNQLTVVQTRQDDTTQRLQRIEDKLDQIGK